MRIGKALNTGFIRRLPVTIIHGNMRNIWENIYFTTYCFRAYFVPQPPFKFQRSLIPSFARVQCGPQNMFTRPIITLDVKIIILLFGMPCLWL